MFTIQDVLADKAKNTNYSGIIGRARRAAQGAQDRFNGSAPLSSDPDYFRGYCQEVCNEIAEEAGRYTRATWWGEAD